MTGDLHTTWARLFIASLVGAGVRDFVISPGSRSTPLALAAAAETRARVQVILDERSAAFFALGQARGQGVASALICTSGTAGAHYLPAVIEASQSHLPMLLLTADRPWEDYDAAAAQTIDQVKLFGAHVRHYAELGLPDAAPAALHAVVRIAAQAAHSTRFPHPGPVHINARFRKPLEPIAESTRSEPWTALAEKLLADGAPRVFAPAMRPDDAAVLEVATYCAQASRGIIVCGPAWPIGDPNRFRNAVQALAEATGFPIFAEATSGARFGIGAHVIGSFDAFLRSPTFRKAHRPEVILELGSPSISSSYAAFLAELDDARRIVVAPHGWNDPAASASMFVFSDPAALAEAVAHELRKANAARNAEARTQFHQAIATAEQTSRTAVDAERDEAILGEGDVARAVVDALPAQGILFVGNSLPVRDLDTYCPASEKPLTVLHQRGASGIDGLISGAAGTRSVRREPMALLLGDLSALHDVGGLNTLREVRGPLAVVIVQNQGGRIFAMLPIGKNKPAQPHFEALFLTPQNADFAHAAQLFDVPFVRAHSRAELANALATAMRSDRPLIIEAIVPPEDGTARRARIFERISKALSQEPTPRVYLHGFLGTPDAFSEIATPRVGKYIAPYLPGHGESPLVLPNADFDAAVDAFAAKLPEGRCQIVGYSMGARLALALAVRHPSRVASLVLIGVDPGLRDDESRTARIAWEDQLAERLTNSSLNDFIDHWESLPIFATQRALDAQRLARQRAARGSHDATALAWAMRTLGTGRMPDFWPHLPQLAGAMPITVLTGELDTKFTAIGRRMAEQAPGVRHVVVPAAGHNLLLEAPDAVLAAMTNQAK